MLDECRNRKSGVKPPHSEGARLRRRPLQRQEQSARIRLWRITGRGRRLRWIWMAGFIALAM
jgi:hypothetical protein